MAASVGAWRGNEFEGHGGLFLALTCFWWQFCVNSSLTLFHLLEFTHCYCFPNIGHL